MKNTNLKPNGIARTVYPDQPCTDFNEWSAHITSKEIERDLDILKAKFDKLWDDFKKDIVRNF